MNGLQGRIVKGEARGMPPDGGMSINMKSNIAHALIVGNILLDVTFLI